MRYLTILLTCTIGSSLLADAIGTIDFSFPPSATEWRLLLDTDSIDLSDEESTEDADSDMGNMKIFTHRAGDALETFMASSDTLIPSEDNDEEESENLSSVDIQQFLSEVFNKKYFPNHQILVNPIEEADHSFLAEWEWNDGVGDIMHGYIRKIFKPDNYLVMLLYSTTAEKSEMNRMLWTHALKEATVIE